MNKRAIAGTPAPEQTVNEPDVLAKHLRDDGVFPNSGLPLLVYRGAVRLPEHDPAATSPVSLC
jgi:hypothetical protein